MNDAPLVKALRALAEKRYADGRQAARFHMPGHKGKAPFDTLDDFWKIDFTEIEGAGNLFAGDEPILSAERAAARFYGAADCLFLTGGSTQGLMAMLRASGASQVICDRNCHKAAAHAMALLSITPQYLFPNVLNEFGFTGCIDCNCLETALKEYPHAGAVLVTSPNYYGVCQDIRQIADLCHQYGRLLLVDEAHGAHFPAVGLPSAIALGADMAAVSAHKTLPALGQSAMLLSNGIIQFDIICEAAALFGSSSPSYLLMASIDAARAYVEQGEGKARYLRAAQMTQKLRQSVDEETPFRALTQRQAARLDPTRLTVCCAGTDWDGYALLDWLFKENGIAAEMADARNVVFIVTCADEPEDLERVLDALKRCQAKARPMPETPPLLPEPKRRIDLRKAYFSPSERVPLSKAAGRICARAVTPYPPGVPILCPGEEIQQLHIEFLKQACYTSIKEISVISNT